MTFIQANQNHSTLFWRHMDIMISLRHLS